MDVTAVENRPESPAKRDSLAEDLQDAGAGGDAEVVAAAQRVLAAVANHVPGGRVGDRRRRGRAVRGERAVARHHRRRTRCDRIARPRRRVVADPRQIPQEPGHDRRNTTQEYKIAPSPDTTQRRYTGVRGIWLNQHWSN